MQALIFDVYVDATRTDGTQVRFLELWEVFSHLYPLTFYTLSEDNPLPPGDYVLVGRRESTLIKNYIAQGHPNGAYFNEGYHWVYVGEE